MNINEIENALALMKTLAAIGPKTKSAIATEAGRRIVILDKGFIYYGDVSYEGDEIVIRNGGNVRYYSEPNGGLVRLASHKPSDKTKLDPVATEVRAPRDRVQNTILIGEGGI